MPDYIYLLANRLSPAQQSALQSIREAARQAGMTVFLTGGAVRDLTSGSPVRDLDVSVQGNALELKAKLVEGGAVIWGEDARSQTLFARFPGSVRVEVGSTRREEFPKPGKPVYHPGSILEDLRRRDFTANAMALSLNEGSYGLLMDPLNGVADLEARLLRLVSNYGFLEDPIRLIRAARLQARLGWEIEEKTKVRFGNAREEGVISHISPQQLGYEVEEIVHEEDGLKILKALEADGWMKVLYPAWTSAKADADSLEALREISVQLQMQGVNPDPSAAQAQLLTAKMAAKDVAALKKLFVRQGFVHEWEGQDERAKEVGKRLTGKEATTPSAAWKLLTTLEPEAILWLALISKSAPVQAVFKNFFTVWPEARQRIPYSLMQEMRIVPELEGYQELVKSIFFELIDGKLTTDEEIRAFLEPHSPPAPPPPVSIRRTRSKKSADKNREVRDEAEDDESAEARPGRDDEDAEEADEEGEAGDERGELVARSGLRMVPDPPQISVSPPIAIQMTAEAPESEAVPEAPTLAVAKAAAVPVAKADLPAKAEATILRPNAKPESKHPSKSSDTTPMKASPVPAGPVSSEGKHAPAKLVAKTAAAPKGLARAAAPAARAVSAKASEGRPAAGKAFPAKSAHEKAAAPAKPHGKVAAKSKPPIKSTAAKAKPLKTAVPATRVKPVSKPKPPSKTKTSSTKKVVGKTVSKAPAKPQFKNVAAKKKR